MAVHAVDIEVIYSEERGDEVYLDEEKESVGNAVQDLIDRKILKFPEKATMDVDQNPFPNTQVNMAAAERRTREISADPKAKGKAKMYPEVRCQCEVTLKVVPPKPKEPTKEPTQGTYQGAD
ncbi:unnamed protein product [Prunus armeniaca]|uniref:Uncharacterized protein n=1 Tax=Prunus armeniaca TaxID=36596 RepID=A0A6J5TIV4_PRUAR|nr:unnamed protein product [Prunus armeniaca]